MKRHGSKAALFTAILFTSCVQRAFNHSSTYDALPVTKVAAQSEVHFCPTKSEYTDARAKLLDFVDMKISTKEFLLRDNTKTIKNPITLLQAEGDSGSWLPLAVNPDAETTVEDWTRDADGKPSFRNMTVSMKFVRNGTPGTITWAGYQEFNTWNLSLSHGNMLITIGSNEIGYQLVQNQPNCDQDAYQGEQPGTLAYGTVLEGRVTSPYRIQFEGRNNNFAIDFQGRSAIGGFDKTIFMAIDSVALGGLSPQMVTISGRHIAVMAPVHHNWGDTFLIDLRRASLTDEQWKKLPDRSFVLLRVRPLTEEERTKYNVPASAENYRVRLLEAIDLTGTKAAFLGIVEQK